MNRGMNDFADAVEKISDWGATESRGANESQQLPTYGGPETATDSS